MYHFAMRMRLTVGIVDLLATGMALRLPPICVTFSLKHGNLASA